MCLYVLTQEKYYLSFSQRSITHHYHLISKSIIQSFIIILRFQSFIIILKSHNFVMIVFL